MSDNMPASTFAKVLQGILNYRASDKASALHELRHLKEHPHEPYSLLFSCMDSRVISSLFTHSHLGDNYIVRNAGDMVPLSDKDNPATTEAGALELGVIRSHLKHVVVCGHSDCKAMGLLYKLGQQGKYSADSALEAWIYKNGIDAFQKFKQLNAENNCTGPLTFLEESPGKTFEVFIDPDNKFDDVDKLSQVNTIQQLEHIASYPFMKPKLANKEVLLHALWYDVRSANVFMLSKGQKKFIDVNDDSYAVLLSEVEHFIS